MKHETKIRVRFSDTDMNGHVNNAVYASYMEESRVQFLYDVQSSHLSGLILASLHINYRAQIRLQENPYVAATTWISRVGTRSFDFLCEIRSETGQLMCDGTAVIVCFDYGTQTSIAIPDELLSKLQPYVVTDDALK